MKAFEFDAAITKAWKDDKGKFFVRAVASDDLPDAQRDRMTERSLKNMAEQAKGGLPILETHRSTFEFGRTVAGEVVKGEKSLQFALDIELDTRYPQALALYDEVASGKPEKQLSIGGKINTKNPSAWRFEDGPTGIVRAIDDVILDHIATTRKGHAANDRTKFVSVIAKSLDAEEGVEVGAEISKNVVKYETAAPVIEQAKWDCLDCDALVGKMGWAGVRDAHAWFDEKADATHADAPEMKTAYRLPHHVMKGNGLAVQFPGVEVAMATLLGARGGVDLPKSDQKGVWAHLAQHMRDKGMTPPDYEDTIFAEKDGKPGQPWTHEEFAAWMERTNKVDVASFGITKLWWSEEFAYWITKEEHEAMKKSAQIEQVQPPTPAPVTVVEETPAPPGAAEKDAVQGLSFLQRLGRALRISGEPAASKEVTPVNTAVAGAVAAVAAPPGVETEKGKTKEAEGGKPFPGAAPPFGAKPDGAPKAESVDPVDGKCPASHPTMKDGKCWAKEAAKSSEEQVKSAVDEFVSGKADAVQTVKALREAVGTEKVKVEAAEDAIYEAAHEAVGKAGYAGKKRVTRLAEAHTSLGRIIAELKGETEAPKPAAAPAASPEAAPVGAGPTEKGTVQVDAAAIEKALGDRFSAALEKTLGDFQKDLLEKMNVQHAELVKTTEETREAAKDALSKSAELAERVEAIELAGGVATQSIEGQDEAPEAGEEATHKSKPWGGMFRTAITKANAKM
jgi:hypothetical protein